MSFWNRLRWTATLAFVALFALSWIGAGRTGPSSPDGRGLRPAPTFHR